MQNFVKLKEETQQSWWNQELSKRERQDIRDTFMLLLETGAVKRGMQESTTGNLKAVLDHLLAEKPEYYKDKVDSKQNPNSLKGDQCYNLVYHLTKQRVVSAVPGRMTPSKISMERDDELIQTDTHSSAQKAVQSQSFQVLEESQDHASSQHEESESVSQQENVTIFAPGMVFPQKEPMAVGKPPAIIQQESEDEEMHQAEESVLKPDSEEAQVNQIINAFNFAAVF